MGADRKKICLVSPEYPPLSWGGLARTVVRVAAASQEMGLEPQVAHLRVADKTNILLDENRQTETVDGVTVHRLTAGREFFEGGRSIYDCPHTLTFRMWYQSLEILHRREAYDLFVGFFLYPVGYVTTMIAGFVARPSVVMLLGNDIKKYTFSPEKVAMCRAGLERADRITSLARDLIDRADVLTPIKAKARTIHGSYPLPARAWQPRRRIKKFGFAGDFKYAKGLPYLFKAIGELMADHEVELELVGRIRDSERAIFEEMKDRTGVGPVLSFAGSIPHEEMPAWLTSLDAFVLPSVSEGCPNILMEAMASGLPCVSTDVGDTDRMIEDRRTGLLVPYGDSAALARALARFIKQPAEAALMGTEARYKVERDFSTAKEARAWQEVFREVLDF